MYKIYSHIERNLLVIFLSGLLLFLSSCDYLKQKLMLGEYSIKAAIEWAKADSARVADSLKMVIAGKNKFEEILTDSLISLDDTDPTPADTSHQYFIISGSFSNHDNAVKEAAKYSSQGFNATIVTLTGSNGAPLELVSVKAFSSVSEAREFLKGFKGIYDPEAWLYSKR